MNFSQITDDLFIGSMPDVAGYETLHNLGVRLVLNMRFARRLPAGLPQPPIDMLWLRTFDSPLLPMPLDKIIQGVHAALGTISKGGKIYSHCAVGRHRSVAMGAAILIAQGHTPQSAMDIIKEKRAIADPDVFYIKNRIMVFSKRWHTMK